MKSSATPIDNKCYKSVVRTGIRSAHPFPSGLRFAFDFEMLEKFEAFQIAKKFYQECKHLKIPRFLQDQLQRASSSIALNLAEGSGKRTPQDQRRFYAIAFGSLRECQAILELENVTNPEIRNTANRLGAILYKLSRKNILTDKPDGNGCAERMPVRTTD